LEAKPTWPCREATRRATPPAVLLEHFATLMKMIDVSETFAGLVS
jgi:hypothetical protein